MQIIFLGHSSFKIKGRQVTIITDPYDSSVGFKFPKQTADIVTCSHNHGDHNQKEAISGSPFVIDAPGEYEVKGVFILGISTFHDNSFGSQRGRNICFVYELDNLKIAHLGDLGHKLEEEELEEMGEIDILMVPMGGVYTLGPKEAVEVYSQIEPKIVIPMHYKTEEHSEEIFAKLSGVEDFVKEVGEEPKRLPRLVITRDKLPEEQEIVLLEAKHG